MSVVAKCQNQHRLVRVKAIENIVRNEGIDANGVGVKFNGRRINNLRYADDKTILTYLKEEHKELILNVKEASIKRNFKRQNL